ncbi:MAG TPA: TlpA disulfide reductase family protein, partial [Chitinophagaceae bacterium]|nr:TlpA disulfide reductase family protein [Chitinophagaceae bacterium]
MKPILLTLLLFPFISKTQYIHTDVQVTFDLPENPTQLFIVIASRQRIDSIPFPANNQWVFKDTISEPCKVDIYISKNIPPLRFWVDDKPVRITCKQTTDEQNRPRLITHDLSGSKDVYFFNHIVNGLHPNHPIYYHDPKYSKEENNSIAAKQWNDITLHFIDSVVNANNGSPVIPHFIRYYRPTLGAEGTGRFYTLLSNKIQNSIEGKQLKKYLDLSVLLTKGELFDDFTMPDHQSNQFRLSDVKAKYILLDFWGSWCAPCRYDN